LFFLALPLRIAASGQSLLHLPCIESDQFHERDIAKEHVRQLIHRLAAKEDFEQIQQEKLHRRDQDSLSCQLNRAITAPGSFSSFASSLHNQQPHEISVRRQQHSISKHIIQEACAYIVDIASQRPRLPQ
jgi:hypothetical protein